MPEGDSVMKENRTANNLFTVLLSITSLILSVATKVYSCEDISGEWNISETVFAESCVEQTSAVYDTYTIIQDGCDITVSDDNGLHEGSVVGTKANWNASYSNVKGDTVAEYRVDISANRLKGSAFWSRSNAGVVCSGSSSLSAAKALLPPPEIPDFRVSATGEGMSFEWDPVPSATKYVFYYAHSANELTRFGGIDLGSQTTISIMSGSPIYVAVKACNNEGCSNLSKVELFEGLYRP